VAGPTGADARLVLLVTASPAVHTMAIVFSSTPRMGDGEGRSSVTGLTIHSDGEITFDDAVRGDINFPTDFVPDFVLARANGEPHDTLV
jgi:glutamyl/glutaminyl-tRNA synthetase